MDMHIRIHSTARDVILLAELGVRLGRLSPSGDPSFLKGQFLALASRAGCLPQFIPQLMHSSPSPCTLSSYAY